MDREDFVIPRSKLGALGGSNRKLLQRAEKLFSSNVEVSSSGDPIGEWVTLRGEKSEISRAKEYIISLCDPQEETVLAYPIELHGALVGGAQQEAEYKSSAVVLLGNGDAIIQGTALAVAVAVSILENYIERLVEPLSAAVMAQSSLADGFDINETLARTFERHHSDMDPCDLSEVPENIKFMMVEQMGMEDLAQDSAFRHDAGGHGNESSEATAAAAVALETAHISMATNEQTQHTSAGVPASSRRDATGATGATGAVSLEARATSTPEGMESAPSAATAATCKSSASRPLLACNFSTPMSLNMPKSSKPAAAAAAASVSTSTSRGDPSRPPVAIPPLESQLYTSTQSQRLWDRASSSESSSLSVAHTSTTDVATTATVTARPSLWNTPATVSMAMAMFPGSGTPSPPVLPGSSDMTTAIASLRNVVSSSSSSPCSNSAPRPRLGNTAPAPPHLNAPLLLTPTGAAVTDSRAGKGAVFANTPFNAHQQYGSSAASSERNAALYPQACPSEEPVLVAAHPPRVAKGKKSQNYVVPPNRTAIPAAPTQAHPLHPNAARGADAGVAYRSETSKASQGAGAKGAGGVGGRGKTRMLREVTGLPGTLRPIVIDGSNIAMGHGHGEVFSCRGLRIVTDHFVERGHTSIMTFVPHHRQRHDSPDGVPVQDKHILQELMGTRQLTFTPSRVIGGRHVVSYDDRFIIRLAQMNGGVVVSNDQYRDLLRENAAWRPIIEKHLLPFVFVDDFFFLPDDPLGRSGPSLEKFLMF